MRLWPESFLRPEDHDRFCKGCDGHGMRDEDGVWVVCDRCDGVRRVPNDFYADRARAEQMDAEELAGD